ncbi:FecR family protein [Puia sp. P3]|uniref:FecR family protein n=1 Tax=Puia sp. P3 TaxID=3423952 RepID=UPI003D667064
MLDYLQQHPEEVGLGEWEAVEPASVGPVLPPGGCAAGAEGAAVPEAGAEDVLAGGGGGGRSSGCERMGFWSKSGPAGSVAVAAGEQGAVSWVYRTNETDSVSAAVLPDGSRVKLYAHSALRYADSFGAAGRDSWLVGSAEFDVVKDRVHPFTVHGRWLATTALGTVFSVNTRGNETVKLYSGKVVVMGLNKDVYLVPGEQIDYDSRRMVARVSRFGKPVLKGGKEVIADKAALAFNNSPLTAVFRKLGARYNTKFSYRASDLAGLNFTGAVENTDSLDVFLRLLAGMNNLDIVEQPGGYRVVRRGN